MPTMPIVEFGHTEIAYRIKRSHRKTVSITVDPHKGVVISAPVDTPEEKLTTAIHKKGAWIIEKLAYLDEINPSPSPKEFLSGEKFMYLGRRYRFKAVPRHDVSHVHLRLIQGKFIAEVPQQLTGNQRREALRQGLISWYIDHAKEKIPERVDLYKKRLDVCPSKIVVKSQQKRWGSCTKDGVVNYNWKAVMAPMSVLDYIVVHELCHLLIADHSGEFWRMINRLIPTYEQRKDWLRKNGPMLTV